MYAKFKTNLIGLAVALGMVLVGYGFSEPPMASQTLSVDQSSLAQVDELSAGKARHGALKRQLAMPYVSIASLLPRQES